MVGGGGLPRTLPAPLSSVQYLASSSAQHSTSLVRTHSQAPPFVIIHFSFYNNIIHIVILSSVSPLLSFCQPASFFFFFIIWFSHKVCNFFFFNYVITQIKSFAAYTFACPIKNSKQLHLFILHTKWVSFGVRLYRKLACNGTFPVFWLFML